jgi:hypothetical protein
MLPKVEPLWSVSSGQRAVYFQLRHRSWLIGCCGRRWSGWVLCTVWTPQVLPRGSIAQCGSDLSELTECNLSKNKLTRIPDVCYLAPHATLLGCSFSRSLSLARSLARSSIHGGIFRLGFCGSLYHSVLPGRHSEIPNASSHVTIGRRMCLSSTSSRSSTVSIIKSAAFSSV